MNRLMLLQAEWNQSATQETGVGGDCSNICRLIHIRRGWGVEIEEAECKRELVVE